MPHRFDITPETIKSLSEFPKEWNGIEFGAADLPNSNLIQARNDLLWGGEGETPFDDSIDLYLFWDSDNTGTIDDFKKMIELDKPAVFGLYPFNRDPARLDYFVGGSYVKGYPGCTGFDYYIPKTMKKLFEGLDLWGGLGFTLIRKSLLKSLKYPWIEGRVVKAPDEYLRKFENVYDDVGLCLKMREAGIPIVLDGRLNIGHVPRNPGKQPEIAPGEASDPQTKALIAMSMIGQLAEQNKILLEQVAKK